MKKKRRKRAKGSVAGRPAKADAPRRPEGPGRAAAGGRPAGPAAKAAVVAGVLLVVATVAAYVPVLDHDFVHYDDDAYVFANEMVRRGLSLDGIGWAFTTTHASNWHPLTWLSHMLDCELFGLDAGKHHMVSVLIHAVSAVLLLIFLLRATAAPGPALLVAALFALHPLRVESVAWAAERKDVLAGLFFMLTLLAYARYVRRRRRSDFAWVAAALALGLMAKPTLVTVPLVLLLLDVWPLRRRERFGAAGDDATAAGERWRDLIREKTPLFALAALSAALTLVAQAGGSAIASFERLTIGARLLNAVASYGAHLWKTVWPAGLAYFYPHPGIVSPAPLSDLALPALGGALLLGAITAIVWRWRATRPLLAVGWLWYLVMLAPMIGVVQVGSQAMADRYTYLPLIGIYVVVAWTLAALVARAPELRVFVAGGCALAVVALAVATRSQVAHWRDSRALFGRALAVTADNYRAHNGLGNVLEREDRIEEARVHYASALRILPDFAPAHNNLGLLLKGQGDLDDAIRHYELALRADPDDGKAHNNLGAALVQQGRMEEAESHYLEALRVDPGHAAALNNLANIHYRRGELDRAAELYARALRSRPDYADAHRNLGVVQAERGDLAAAAGHYRRALAGDPEMHEVAANLAWILATHPDPAVRDGREAIRWAERASAAYEHQEPALLNIVAAAHAEAGDFEEAVRWQEEAVRLAPAEFQAELGARVDLFRSGRPYRDGTN